MIYEYLPKALLAAAKKRGIPVIFQAGGVVRQPFAKKLNAFCLIDGNTSELIGKKYDDFSADSTDVPMLSRKGILRLFASETFIADVHNIDNEPEYDVGVLYNGQNGALDYVDQEVITDSERRKLLI